MMHRVMRSPQHLALGCFYALCIIGAAQAQNQSQPPTDPAEVRALNSIFQKWGISARRNQWNISGEPCSGAALDSDSTDINNDDYNPFVKCNCSFNNGSTCHITHLKVFALNVVGPIPDEIWTLTFLTNLRLGQNYLTGPLSASIGNLTRMQWLALGHNALSGELPKEIGLLTDLRFLAIGTNNFSGPLPSEIGNCSMLEQLYFDSSGVTGEIPSTFTNLPNLLAVSASDTELTGRIPDFIGNWSKLRVLRFQGNSFEGSMPSTFSNLTSLTELRISGLSNGSSLSFMKEMKSLNILELRNNNISDTIPSTFGEYQSLRQLDLSFNNITGQIPDSLFSLSSLNHLFLGNNKLHGSLPAQKSSSLRTINLVANNFTIGQSNSSVLPSGLNCLQRNFPCNRGRGTYSNFAIKCGGPQITSSDGTLFERDDETLGPASYYVTDTNSWAVSNVGYFAESKNPQYKISSSSQSTSTLDSKLFQTARVSASSLRYYGLGLENGNYTVRLQFAEIEIMDTKRWESLGRRVFDIYIQGNLVLEDFDIRKEAGGVSKRAVPKEFKAQVSENYLEIHLFWAGKGTCCVPAEGKYGPSISAISATPDFIPTVNNNAPTSKKSRTGLIVGIVVGVGVVSLLSVAAFCIFRKRRAHRKDDEELLGIDARPYTFSYAELKAATEDFNPENKLGEGGFGPVYEVICGCISSKEVDEYTVLWDFCLKWRHLSMHKGKLDDGRVIAVKQLSIASRQGKSEFVTEIATISAVQHRNLVKLYGCCFEADQCLLVYEYLENKSLDQILFGKNLNLSWSTRYDICLGVARGLAYLHEESSVRIVHRDVKASNILLSSKLIPKISDFGLAKLYDDKKTHISTRVAGTMYRHCYTLVMGVNDIFSYTDLHAWYLHENNREVELVDGSLSEFNEEEVKRVIGIALLCTQASPMRRPSMSRVVAMLLGDAEVSRVVSKPGYLTDWKFDDTSFMSNQATRASETSYDTSTSATIVANTENSPMDVTKPMLHSIIGEER
ncbi:Serine-threonine/tyrosine-protein kinase [Theobroma cacao]|nr:Serine-threonine/tyrosine-protein kinase [Theobroma cacao]